jgi:hypothetical protein
MQLVNQETPDSATRARAIRESDGARTILLAPAPAVC